MADVVDLIMADHRDVEQLFEILRNHPEQRLTAMPTLAALLVATRGPRKPRCIRSPGTRPERLTKWHSQEEHAQAEQLLERLQAASPASRDFDNVLTELIDAVTHHVEEEESQVPGAGATRRLARAELARPLPAPGQTTWEMAGEANRDELL